MKGDRRGVKRTNQAAIALIKHFEGFSAAPYEDAAGVWTVGYGHTRGVTPNTPPIGEARAELLLEQDVAEAEGAVQRAVLAVLNDNQFSALVSLCFNIGPGAFRRSTLAMRLNAGDYAGAANEFPRWRYAGGKVLEGLVKRREAEKALFLRPIENRAQGGAA